MLYVPLLSVNGSSPGRSDFHVLVRLLRIVVLPDRTATATGSSGGAVLKQVVDEAPVRRIVVPGESGTVQRPQKPLIH